MIIRLEGVHVVMPTPQAVDLVELLEQAAEMLRYGCSDLFTDSEDGSLTSGENDRLIEAIEQHTQTLRSATQLRLVAGAIRGPIP